MPLALKNYPNPHDPTTPLPEAYAVVTGFTVDAIAGNGITTYTVYASEAAAAAGGMPIDTIPVAFGQKFGDKHYPTSGEWLANAQLQLPYSAVLGVMEQTGIAVVPQLAGAVQVGS